MRLTRRDYQTVEIQMGPMIDMVFLLLVFFMVTARPEKQESDINLGLPGAVSQEESIDIPDEARIRIEASGAVALNDLQMGAPGDAEMPALLTALRRFKEAAAANKAEALLTIDADDAAVQQRIVDVLNVCAQARITGVTFASSDDEDL